MQYTLAMAYAGMTARVITRHTSIYNIYIHRGTRCDHGPGASRQTWTPPLYYCGPSIDSMPSSWRYLGLHLGRVAHEACVGRQMIYLGIAKAGSAVLELCLGCDELYMDGQTGPPLPNWEGSNLTEDFPFRQ